MRELVGDKRRFYRRVWATALPMMAQNFITMFVSMLDNLMVGQLSTAQIGSVSIINNNLLFIFYLCLFGGIAGAGIFVTQFYGSGDHDSIRQAMRFQMIISFVLTGLGIGVFLLFGDSLIGLYLQADGDPVLAADTLHYAKKYLNIMLWGLIPYAVTNTYAGTLKVCGHPTVAMVASLGATAANLVGNWLLIFGNLGCPALGIEGAAIATVLSRFVEAGILVAWTHLSTKKVPYIRGLYRSMHISGKLLKAIATKGLPLLLNETMWSFGMAFLNQCYSVWGQDVNAAMGICSTLFNLAAVSFKALGSTVGIITGQLLGADVPSKDVRRANNRMTWLCLGTGAVFGLLMAAANGLFPRLYQTTDSVRAIASGLILIAACDVLLQAYIYPVYFTLRAGGKTMITFFFDCGAIWILSLPLAYILSRFSSLHVFTIYAIVTGVDAVKCLIGIFMLKSNTWMQKLTVQ